MSLDLYLQSPACKTCGHSPEAIHYNYTYNVADMWRAALSNDERMVEIDGLSGADSIAKLNAGIEALEKDPARFRAMNPPNGWGDYDSFLNWLKNVRESAKANPDWVWDSWR